MGDQPKSGNPHLTTNHWSLPLLEQIKRLYSAISTQLGILLVIIVIGATMYYFFTSATGSVRSGNQEAIYGTNYPSLEGGAVYGFLLLLLVLLAALPQLLIYTYNRIRLEKLYQQTIIDLSMAGLFDASESAKVIDDVVDTTKRNHKRNFSIPSTTMTIFLFLFWGLLFAPRGVSGLLFSLGQGGEIVSNSNNPSRSVLGVPEFLEFLVNHSSPVSWAFLGAYFYILSSLIRRWMQSDLTVGFIWRANIRILVILILGLLLILGGSIITDDDTLTASDDQDAAAYTTEMSLGELELIPRDLSDQDRYLMLIAFFGGIIPNSVFFWITTRIKALTNLNGSGGIGNWFTGLFKPAEIQRNIDGLSFWQADRLSEEGIESVSDLATKELKDLLVNTRFESKLLMGWIDEALLYMQRSQSVLPISLLRDVSIWRASDLLDIWYWGCDDVRTNSRMTEAVPEITMERRKRFVNTLLFAIKTTPEKIKLRDEVTNTTDQEATADLVYNMLENIVNGVESGANIEYLREYWRNDNPACRKTIIEELVEKKILKQNAADSVFLL